MVTNEYLGTASFCLGSSWRRSPSGGLRNSSTSGRIDEKSGPVTNSHPCSAIKSEKDTDPRIGEPRVAPLPGVRPLKPLSATDQDSISTVAVRPPRRRALTGLNHRRCRRRFSAVDHPLGYLGVPRAMRLDLRVLDLAQVVGCELDVGGGQVFLEPV